MIRLRIVNGEKVLVFGQRKFKLIRIDIGGDVVNPYVHEISPVDLIVVHYNSLSEQEELIEMLKKSGLKWVKGLYEPTILPREVRLWDPNNISFDYTLLRGFVSAMVGKWRHEEFFGALREHGYKILIYVRHNLKVIR